MKATNWRLHVIALGLLGVLGVAGWSVWSNERILAEGQVVHLELAPVDPRSLMQGDYMVLNYAVADTLRRMAGAERRADGFAVLRLDAQRVGQLVRTAPTLAEGVFGPPEPDLWEWRAPRKDHQSAARPAAPKPREGSAFAALADLIR